MDIATLAKEHALTDNSYCIFLREQDVDSFYFRMKYVLKESPIVVGLIDNFRLLGFQARPFGVCTVLDTSYTEHVFYALPQRTPIKQFCDVTQDDFIRHYFDAKR